VPRQYHLLPEDEAARYRLHHNSLLNEGYVRTFIDKIGLIHQYCTDARTVLDYGCGTEPVLAELLKLEGFVCDFYDPNFFPGLPNSSYNLVISTEVFEHLRDIMSEISNMRALLDHAGFLAVMTSFHDPVKNIENWWYLGDPTHICFFGKHTFEWIAEKFGFNIIYSNNKNFIIFQVK
jgi:SAM-dependent methyltransferase